MYPAVSKSEAAKTPYPYVFVLEDGSYRELTQDERSYLEEAFHPADGNRPYLKARFNSETPDGRLSGFCKRSKVPKGLKPGDKPENKQKWWRGVFNR